MRGAPHERTVEGGGVPVVVGEETDDVPDLLTHRRVWANEK
jgi:hypothetical protein